MEKKCDLGLNPPRWLKKFLLVMRITGILCLVCVMHLSAAVYSQTARINLKMKDATIEQVLNRISESTKMDFFYSNSKIDVAKKVNVDFFDATLEEALRALFKGCDVKFEINDNFVVIHYVRALVAADTLKKITVMGTVKDVDGMTLPGVTIQVKGTTIGFTTNLEGKFNFDLPQRDSLVLIFSYVGFQKQEVRLKKDNKPLNIVMKNDLAEIDEVVVTGIFNKPKESFTGAVKHITKEDIMAFGNRNLLQTLNNIDPAFVIRENNTYGSNPNVLPEIQIRGISGLPDITNLQSSARAELNQPLFVLDGFEVTLERVMDLNPADVESVTILKDASSTALYGSRGANGVVVITSTKPRQGKLRISVTAGLNVEIPDLSSYNLLGAKEKLELEERAGLYNSAVRQDLYRQNARAVAEGVDTYWIGKPVRTGIGQDYMLDMGGGDEQFRYTMNLSYKCVAGAMKGSFRNNFNGTLGISYFFDKFRFMNTFTLGLNNSEESPYGTFSDYVTMNPYWYPYDENGRVVKSFYTFGSTTGVDLCPNPLWEASINKFNKSKYTNIRNAFRVEWDVAKGLKLATNIGYTTQTDRDDRFSPKSSNDFNQVSDPDGKGSYTWEYREMRSWQWNFNAAYGNTFGRHSVYGGVDGSFSETKNLGYMLWLRGFANDNLTDISNAAQFGNERPSSSESHSRQVSFTLTGNYNYASRYFFDFSYRLDGASSFGSNNRFAPFWSIGCGYTVSQENFFQERLPWVNLLRLRYSYGVNSALPSDTYKALTTYEYDRSQRYEGDMGAMLKGIGNENLRWQNTYQHNIGVDLTLFNEIVSIQGNYYRKETKNYISDLGLTYSHGFEEYTENVGNLRNVGGEVNVSVNLLRNQNIMWSVRGATSWNKNTIVTLSDAMKKQNEQTVNNQTGSFIYLQYKEGESMDAIYTFISPGVDVMTGEVLYMDRNGRISSEIDMQAKVKVGNEVPKVNARFSTMFRYKSFSLNTGFELRLGGQKLNQTLLNKVENAYVEVNVDKRVLTNRWEKPGDKTPYRGLANTKNTVANNRFVMDESTFIWRNINLQYDFPRRICKYMGMERLSLSASMMDLLYLSTIEQERGTAYPFAVKPSFSISCTF
ncbi:MULTISPECIES: SusC/RagA family TonB-linked outer membrane protein [Butyricimonas]|uniref:SusC/RagA family TonB-linked outer membrane protein n=1 Tax=Butyricimonas TaxID=574697 RepID=UPI001D076E0B|nr:MULTISPECIES: SusC/RagA family TonB-linked outer membrane protein [Butyricimonas]MCB6973894.1 SusC/RagA family TonB-linked outer membrane protein [Butyricimonas synergistica]MCG4520763.1 SusC/RagA family TonB-linked outer membrane protein [Butyricimonas sp. DFI.6.44]